MVNEISQSVLGGSAVQTKGASESPGRVRESSRAESAGAVIASAPGKQAVSDRQPTEAVDEKSLGKAVEQLNEFTQSVQRKLEFSVDEESGKTVVKVIDKESGEMVRSIPSEEILDMQKRLKETSEMIFNSNDQGISLLFQGKA